MKRNLYKSMVLVFFSVCIVGGQAFGAPTLYDDFSGPYIDGAKWFHGDYHAFVREVAGGELVSKIGNAYAGYFRNRTPIKNPASINVIKCTVTVEATVLDGIPPRASFARIDGFFYNTQGSGGATGDIYAAVYIGNRGNGGLEAYWEVYEALNDDLTNMEEKGSGTLIVPGTLTTGTPYSVRIEYDGNKGFTFTVHTESEPFTGPDKQGAAVTKYKGLTTGIDAAGGSGTGYASATFDDVYINDPLTLHDNFSTAPLDQTKWNVLEFVREISDEEKLRLGAQADEAFEGAYVRAIYQTTPYLEAKVRVETGSDGAPGRARVRGFYYNDSKGPGSGQDYNGYMGDVFGYSGIKLEDGPTLSAIALILRCEDVNCSTTTVVDSYDFAKPIGFGQEYTFSNEFTGTSLIFTCDGETYTYDIPTPIYPPSIGQMRRLESWVFAGPGQSGCIKATFDNVYTGCTVQPTYNASGTWQYWLSDTWQNCPEADPEPEHTGTLGITQTGDTFTLEVDGNVLAGNICGEMYKLTWSHPEDSPFGDPGTVTEVILITLSSSTSGFGFHRATWVADNGSSSCSWGGFISLIKQIPDSVIDDDFNDGIMDPSLWTPFGNENTYAIETDGRLEIRANGVEDDAVGVQLLGRLISATKDFRVQVDFNSSECSLNSGIVLAVHNATTDLHNFNDYIIIANGHSADMVTSRSWVAAKSINDEFVEITTEPTATTSGTLYIEHTGNLFYVSFTGYGANNAFATFTADGWTSCSEVFIMLAGFTRNQVLSGQDSYLDNFHLDIDAISDTPVIEDIIFNTCISELCTSPISVIAYDPLEGELTYSWEALDGGAIIGSGADVDFDPPGPSIYQGCNPYRVKVSVSSSASGLSTEQIFGITVKLAGDANGDGYVNTKDQKAVRNHFGESGTPGWVAADVNCDGYVNTKDQKAVRNQFGQTGCGCPL